MLNGIHKNYYASCKIGDFKNLIIKWHQHSYNSVTTLMNKSNSFDIVLYVFHEITNIVFCTEICMYVCAKK